LCQAYDVNGEGRITPEKLREVFASYGYGELSDNEVDVIIRAADVDGDGVISMEDFRYMLDLQKLPTLAQFGPTRLLSPALTTSSSSVGSASAPPLTSSSSRDKGDVKERGNNGDVDR
jgi:hypothetical protein